MATNATAMKALMKAMQTAMGKRCRGSYSSALLGVVIAVLIVTLTAGLGVWQLWRAQVKVQAQAQWDAALARAPELLFAAELHTVAERVPLRVRARGQWLSDRTVWLDNRALGGRAGFWKVTPLRLSGAETNARVVLVLRGWAPRDARDRMRLPVTVDAPGEIEIEGVAVAQISHLLQLGAAQQSGPLPAVWQNLDLPSFEAASGLKVERFVLHQTDAAVDAEELTRLPLRVAVGPAQHYGYAAQWFALSALMAGLSIYLGWRQRRAT